MKSILALCCLTLSLGLNARNSLAVPIDPLSCESIHPFSEELLRKHIRFHYLNDDLRQRLVDTYVKRLDPSRSLYRADEIQGLRLQLRGVMQDVRQGDCASLASVYADQANRYATLEEMVKTILNDPNYELDTEAILIIDPEKRSWPQNKAAQKELVTKLIHFQMSNYLGSDMEIGEAKEKLTHRYELSTKRAQERDEEDLYAAYLDTFASALDPHSNYFSRDAWEDFKIDMQLSLDGIGVKLSSREGYSVVEEVIPGGATDRLDVLLPNDKIIAVAQENGEPVDIIDMELRDVVRLIRGERGTTVHLTILRQGETSERFRVSIVRDKINLEERAAKLRLEDVEVEDQKMKLAILELPSFYGGRGPGERQSSDDVARLLKEAKEAKADGLLLDLSRNGGGVLESSVDIAGYFLEGGGVVAVKDTFSQVQFLRDRNEEIAWEGPLVVLTSRVSASASEIVAGALKDYNRAVVVGDDHTFGKGTVQSVIELPEGLGALKVTTALFFRPGGKSTQHDGVAADVVLPSLFATDDFGEAHQTYSLPSQTIPSFIESAPRRTLLSPSSGIAWKPVTPEVRVELARRSQSRTSESEDFAEVRERLAKIEERNGVVHLAELMKEQDEENNEATESESEADSDGTETTEAAAQDDDQPSPQQLEALQILADLVILNT